jgi:hypothetical protein
MSGPVNDAINRIGSGSSGSSSNDAGLEQFRDAVDKFDGDDDLVGLEGLKDLAEKSGVKNLDYNKILGKDGEASGDYVSALLYQEIKKMGNKGPDSDNNKSGPDADNNTGGPDADNNAGGPDADNNAGGPDADNNTSGPDADNNTGGPDADNNNGNNNGDAGLSDFLKSVQKFAGDDKLIGVDGLRELAEKSNVSGLDYNKLVGKDGEMSADYAASLLFQKIKDKDNS